MKLKRFGFLVVLSSTPALSYIRFLAPLGVSVVLLLATPLHAATWYVDNAVASSGSGTSWSSAWKHFSDIVWGNVGAGDTIYISGGSTSQTYNAGTDGTLTIGASGTSGNPITITKGIDAGHNGTVVIDGTPTTASSSYPIDTNSKHDLTIQNLTAQNSTGAVVWIHDSASGLIIAQNLTLHTGGNYPITTGVTSTSGTPTLNFGSALPSWVGANMYVMDSTNTAATPDASTPYQISSVSGSTITLFQNLAQNVGASDVIWFSYIDARGFDIRNNAGQVIVQNNTIDTPNRTIGQTDCEYDPANTGSVTYQYNSCIINNTDPSGHDDCFQHDHTSNITFHGNYCSHPNGGINNHGYFTRAANTGATWTIDSNVFYMPDSQPYPVDLAMYYDNTDHTSLGQVNFYNNTIYGGLVGVYIGNPFQQVKNNIIYTPWGRTAITINPIRDQYLVTNATTAIGNNTLNFASGTIPSWVIAGQSISDITASAAIPAGTTVVSKTATTVVMSANAVSPGVGNGDSIDFVVNFPPANLDYNLVYGETKGNLQALACGPNIGAMRGTQSQPSGQWYYEMKLGTNVSGYGGTNSGIGVANASATLANHAGSDINGLGWFANGGRVYHNGTWGGPYSTGTTGDVIAFAIDFASKRLWMKNITSGSHFWNNSATDNPSVGSQVGGFDFSASGPGGALAAGPYYIYQSLSGADSDVLNAGASSFSGSLPTGYTAWGGTFNPADTGFPASTSICPLYDQINNIYYSWSGSQSAGYNIHGLNSDPKFTNIAGQDFTLQSLSPAIDVGATIASVPTDKTGRFRPVGPFYDIGAYEYAAPPAAPGPVSINAGGSATGTFVTDAGFSGGSAISNWTGAVDTILVPNPAPQAVYQSERYGAFSYAVSGLSAGSPYTVRLHFTEDRETAAGKRIENVSINGTQVLSNFDIFAASGAQHKAIAKTFSATADVNGQIAISLAAANGSPDSNAKVDGLEVLAVSSPPSGQVENFPYVSGDWYLPDLVVPAYGTTSATQANIIRCTPAGLRNKATISNVAASVYTADAAGHVQFAIYTNGANNRPANLVATSASMGTTPAGVISSALSVNVQGGPSGANLADTFWFCSNSDSTTATFASVNSTTGLAQTLIGTTTSGNVLQASGSGLLVSHLRCSGINCNGGSSTFAKGFPASLAGTTWTEATGIRMPMMAIQFVSVP